MELEAGSCQASGWLIFPCGVVIWVGMKKARKQLFLWNNIETRQFFSLALVAISQSLSQSLMMYEIVAIYKLWYNCNHITGWTLHKAILNDRATPGPPIIVARKLTRLWFHMSHDQALWVQTPLVILNWDSKMRGKKFHRLQKKLSEQNQALGCPPSTLLAA